VYIDVSNFYANTFSIKYLQAVARRAWVESRRDRMKEV